MKFDLQPVLENAKATLLPLQENDFEALYAIASDEKIWEQHPLRNSWQPDVFRTWFNSAMESQAAFKIIHKATGQVAGCTRFYEYNETENSIAIGYTFYGRQYWGTGFNPCVKALLLDYLFRYVDRVILHVWEHNIRSQIAVSRLGAVKVGERHVTPEGEAPRTSFVYVLEKPGKSANAIAVQQTPVNAGG